MWLQYVSPVLLSARDLELAIPGTYLRDGQQHAVPRECESIQPFHFLLDLSLPAMLALLMKLAFPLAVSRK
jgi:hypothetical protein